ncbi:hypothetical protein [Bacillus sp. ISL-7]|nr:hypothetical protein [Bacillus sp. ISL-7]MBT2736748.1 hypothetical protein [Bacillus sp. ISL-7]
MSLSEHLTQQKLQAILSNICVMGKETENIQVKDFIEEIKKQLLADSK